MNNERDTVVIYPENRNTLATYPENRNFIELEVANNNADDYVLRIKYLPTEINVLSTYEVLEKAHQTKQIEKVLRECTDYFTLKEDMVSLTLTTTIDCRSRMKPVVGIDVIEHGFQKTIAILSDTKSLSDIKVSPEEKSDILVMLKAFGEKKCDLIGDDTVVVSMDAIPIKSLIQVIFHIMFGIGYAYDAMMSDTVVVQIVIGYSIIPRNDFIDIADIESRIGSQLIFDALRS